MTPTNTDQPPPLPAHLDRPKDDRPKDDVWDTILTGKNLFRVGLALVLLGLVFMFRYAIEAGWVTPVARVGLGAAASVTMLGLGVRLVGIRRGFGTILAGGGVAGLYVTVYAAYELYGLTTPSSAFVQLIAVSALGVGLALRWNAEPLAVAGLAGALVAPLLLPGKMLVASGDAFYFVGVLAAAVLLFVVREWFVLYGSTFVMSSMVAGFEAIRVAFDSPAARIAETDIMVAAILAAFLVVPLIVKVVGTGVDPYSLVGSGVVGPVALGLVGIAHGGSTNFVAWTAFGLAGIHVAVGVASKGETASVMTHGLVAAGLALVGSTILLDGPVAVLAVAVVGAAITLIGLYAELVVAKWAGGLTLALSGLLNIASLTEAGPVGHTIARLAVVGVVGGVAVALDRHHGEGAVVGRNLAASYVYLGGLLVGLVDLATYSQALVTAVWSAVAVTLIMFGSLSDRKTVTRLGIGTQAAILVKVFLIDLATVETIWKMALFLALGVVLLMVGYWISTED